MRSQWRLFLLIAVVVLLTMPLLVTAQDTAPTPTPIPIEVSTTEESAPVLGGVTAVPTQAVDTSTTGTENTTEEAPQFGEVPANTSAGSTCPVGVEDSFTAAEFICAGLQDGEACLAIGQVIATFNLNVQGSFTNSGDITRLTNLSELTLQSTGIENPLWTTIVSKINLNSTDGNLPVTAHMIAFGDLTLVDTGEVASGGAFEGTVLAQRGLVVRRTPANEGVVVWQLNGGDVIQITGRTADRNWLRMEIPSFYGGIGWVYAPYVDVEGGVELLPFVTVNSPAPQLDAPRFGPMQSFLLLSSDTLDDCGADAPDSGLLLQSPSGLPDSMTIEINDVEIQLNGTAFIRAQNSTLSVNVLEGQAVVISNSTPVTGNVGTSVTVTLNDNLEPTGAPQTATFSPDMVSSLPINLLPRQFAMAGMSQPPAAPTEAVAFGTQQTNTDDNTAAQPTEAVAQACTLTVGAEVKNVRSGPGTLYDVAAVMQPNTNTTGTGVANDEFGILWYQVSAGGFMRTDTVTPSGNCDNLPTVEAPPLPTATPTPTDSPAAQALNSSVLGDVTCPNGEITGSATSDGTDTSVAIGGTWTVTSGTSVTFSTLGGQLRPEFGDYIQLIATDGTIIAQSGDGQSLALTFDQDRTFTARFSAANGDVVVMSAKCALP